MHTFALGAAQDCTGVVVRAPAAHTAETVPFALLPADIAPQAHKVQVVQASPLPLGHVSQEVRPETRVGGGCFVLLHPSDDIPAAILRVHVAAASVVARFLHAPRPQLQAELSKALVGNSRNIAWASSQMLPIAVVPTFQSLDTNKN